MIVRINIQSMTDIITNSSSESFIIKAEKTKEELEGILKDMFRRIYPGDSPYTGGVLQVSTLEDLTERSRKMYPSNKRDMYTKEMKALEFPISLKAWDNAFYLDIDVGFNEFIDEILTVFECICGVDTYKVLDDRIIRCTWGDPDRVNGWIYVDDERNITTLEY